MGKVFGGGKAARGKHAARGGAVPTATLLGAEPAAPQSPAPGMPSDPAPKDGRGRKVALIVVGVLVGVVAAVYLVGFAVFSFIFYPNTQLNGADVSLRPASEVSEAAASGLDSFTAEIEGDGFSTTL